MTGLQSRFAAAMCLALLALYGHPSRVRADAGTAPASRCHGRAGALSGAGMGRAGQCR